MVVQIVAAVLFLLVYILLATDKIHRTIVALWGALLFATIPVFTNQGIQYGLLSKSDLLRYENWEALGLIFGLFTIVAALRESGFFRWLGLAILKAAKFDPLRVFILFSCTAAILSAFMDSVTVLMFLTVLTIEACGILQVNPLPFIITEILCANIGGTSTIIGNPPNIIIGTGLHLSFADFIFNVFPFVLVVLAINLVLSYLFFKKIFINRKKIASETFEKNKDIKPESAITDPRLMKISSIIFGLVVVALMFHSVFGISLAFIGILGASLVLLLGGKKMPEVIERIDWHTLIFFACLFIMVGGLEKTGVLQEVSKWIGIISGGNIVIASFIILWFSAIASAVIDNVPFAAAMVPIVSDLAHTFAMPLPILTWAMVLGVNIGGNGTPIGASANVVGLSIYEKRTGKKVTWAEYCKTAIPLTLISVIACTILFFFRYLL
ncbi:MAG: Citrate transporter [Candidatus Saganbacteria bacterium]|uniref:Citrate transporter n=1 Tax=Candidatus Saganbacteria bacterium TaxID=2575572 RepID=A0A833P3L2_UNCSA|nr:MAG: Citrate transporter [Candidatus Saganbacteria bacterium]